MTFLIDVGIEPGDGKLRFGVEDDPAGSGLKRVAADFRFVRARRLQVEGRRFQFRPSESIRLFFSYRHTPDLTDALLGRHGLTVLDRWIAPSEEEAVFLCTRRPKST
jgi:hypothetical protein